MSKISVGYWDIRALAEPIRLILEYCGADYEDRRYQLRGELPNVDRSDWLVVKFKLGLDFPNLPYLIDGDVKMTQQWAIMKYLARKYGNLIPKTEEETRRCDMTQEDIRDLGSAFIRLISTPGSFEDAKKNFLEETVPKHLEAFEKFLSDKDWMAGATLTYVDFEICERLDVLTEMQSDCLDKYLNVKKYKERFFALDKIAAYRSTERFKEYPIFVKMAKWGYKKEN
ncbi:unnamed protein product [Clavelina lepadiformis]|uniref:glutathione transferase n=1 Tax=Clavelina lepadiformis TaxID=159417 RepID=A0ABP0FHC1_CLALP